MRNFVAGLTNDDPEIKAPVYKQYHHVQYNGILAPAATASLCFPPSYEMFRYVIIQQQFSNYQAICLTELKVFIRGIFVYFLTRIRLIIRSPKICRKTVILLPPRLPLKCIA